MKITSSKQTKVAAVDFIGNGRLAAINSIHRAIDQLGDLARDGDEVAKDAIANLSVILFDLQNKE